MNLMTTSIDKIRLIEQKIASATKVVKNKKAAAQRAQTIAERAQDELDELIEERDVMILSSWGGGPDVARLLAANSSEAFFLQPNRLFNILA